MPSKRAKQSVSYANSDEIISFSDEDDFIPGSDPEDVDADVEMDLEAEYDDIKSESPEPEPKFEASMRKSTIKSVNRGNRSQTRPSVASAAASKEVPPPAVVPVSAASSSSKKDSRLNNESLKERYRTTFGEDEVRLMDAVETRVVWGTTQFIPEQDYIEAEKTFGFNFKPQQGDKSPVLSKLVLKSSKIEFKGHKVNFQDGVQLHAGESRSTENIVLLNAGHFVKDARWIPFLEGATQYLATSVIENQDRDPIDANAAAADLSAFNSGSTLPSKLYIWSMNMETQVVEPFAEIDAGSRGPIASMRWRPVAGAKELAIVFGNGTVALIPLPDKKGTYTLGKTQLIQLDTGVSCCTWRDETRLICGTVDGYICEFSTTNFETPLRYHQIHYSLILNVACSFPNTSLATMCTTSVDNETTVTDLENMAKQVSITRSKTFLGVVEYIPMLNCYMTQEDHLLTRVIFGFSPSFPSGTQLTRHDKANVNAVATCLYHPFVLSGATDGSASLVNASRRVLVPRRSLKDEKSITLWTLDCAERTRAYRYIEELKPTDYTAKLKAPSMLYQSPQTCTITSMDWLPTKKYAAWYCAASASGLIRIECLN